jgi:tetratricopeptide (TPR) repeat protein
MSKRSTLARMIRRDRIATAVWLLMVSAAAIHPCSRARADDHVGDVDAAPQTPAPPANASAPLDSPNRLDSARVAVARADALFAVQNYAMALSEFTRALALLEGDPRERLVLHNIAVCYERLFRYDLALTYYQRYVDSGVDDDERARVTAAIRALRKLLATLWIDSNVNAEIWIDDRRAGTTPQKVFVPAGAHVVELRATIRESARREVAVVAGENRRVHFELQALSQYTGIRSEYFWVGTGLTVAALATGSIFGVNALSSTAAAERAAERRMSPAHEAALARHQALVADLCLGAGAVLGIGTAILYFVTDWEERSTRSATGPALRLYAGPVGIGAWGVAASMKR